MKKKIVGILVFMLLIATPLPVSATIGLLTNHYDRILSENETIIGELYDHLDGGWLEERDGVKILHLNGTYYDMGYQHGFLLKNEIMENLRCADDHCERHGWSYEKRNEVWKILKEYLPQVYIEEIEGMADG